MSSTADKQIRELEECLVKALDVMSDMCELATELADCAAHVAAQAHETAVIRTQERALTDASRERAEYACGCAQADAETAAYHATAAATAAAADDAPVAMAAALDALGCARQALRALRSAEFEASYNWGKTE